MCLSCPWYLSAVSVLSLALRCWHQALTCHQDTLRQTRGPLTSQVLIHKLRQVVTVRVTQTVLKNVRVYIQSCLDYITHFFRHYRLDTNVYCFCLHECLHMLFVEHFHENWFSDVECHSIFFGVGVPICSFGSCWSTSQRSVFVFMNIQKWDSCNRHFFGVILHIAITEVSTVEAE